MKLNLNLSTTPLENNRRFIAGASVAGLIGIVALGILFHLSFSFWRANRALRTDISRIEGDIRISETRQRELGTYFETPDAKQVLDRSSFLNSLIEERTFPWPKIFEDLERTLPTGVRIVDISPRLEGGRALVKLTAAAMDDESKVKFLRALENSKVFSNVRVADEKYPDPGQTQGGAAQSTDRVTLTLEVWYSTI